MTKSERYDCLRDLQVTATVPRITEEQIRELMLKKLIKRNGSAGGIWLTTLGVHAKTGEI